MSKAQKLYEEVAERHYREDPVRILFSLLLYSIKGNKLDDYHYFLFLRIRKLITLDVLQTKEARRIIMSAFKSEYAYNFVMLLNEVELLEMVFPSVYALIKIDGGHYHNETVFTHVMGALRAVGKLKIPWFVKLAALYHDVGKQKFEDFDDGRRRFTDHAPFGGRLVECDLRRLKFSRDIISTLKTLVCYHMAQVDGKKSIFKLKRAFDERKVPFKYFFWVRYADNMGSAKYKTDFMHYWKLYKTCLKTLNPPHVPSISDLEINGRTLMEELNLTEGKIIGYILKNLFIQWQENKIENKSEVLMEKAKELKSEFEKENKL